MSVLFNGLENVNLNPDCFGISFLIPPLDGVPRFEAADIDLGVLLGR